MKAVRSVIALNGAPLPPNGVGRIAQYVREGEEKDGEEMKRGPAMGCGQKSFMVVWRSHQLLSEFLANADFARVPLQLRLSAKDKSNIGFPVDTL